MKAIKYVAIALLLSASAAFADVASYDWTPVGPSQHGITVTSATGLTIPSGARMAVVCARSGNVNYEIDGSTTPTGSVGMPLQSGQCVSLQGSAMIQNFKAINQSGNTATLDVDFLK